MKITNSPINCVLCHSSDFNHFLDQLPIAVVIYEPIDDGNNFTLIYINHTAEKIENIQKKDIINKDVISIFPGIMEMGLLTDLQKSYQQQEIVHSPIRSYRNLEGIATLRKNTIIPCCSNHLICIYSNVTEEIQAKNKFTSLFLETKNSIIFVDEITGKIVDFNPQTCKLFNMDKTQLSNLSMDTLCKNKSTYYLALDQLEKQNSVNFETIVQITNSQVSEIPVDLSIHRIKINTQPLLQVIISDLRTRKSWEDSLRWELEFNRKIIDSQMDVIFLLDFDSGIPLRWNQAAKDVTGYNDQQIALNNSLEFWFDKSEHFKIMLNWFRLRKIDSLTFSTRIITKNGSRVPLELSISRLNDKQKEQNYLVVAGRDLRGKIKIEEEKNSLAQRIQHTQKIESLSLMAGGIAHDLNNLLMGILGNTSMAFMDIIPASPLQSYLENIDKAARKAADLARQLLEYSGRGKIHFTTISINEVLTETIKLLRATIPKNIEQRFDLAESLPSVDVDVTQFRQVVMNLLINSIESLEEKPGLLTISTSKFSPTENHYIARYIEPPLKPGNYVCVSIKDSGCGINEKNISKIFDPFFTTKFTGRGLGLAASQGILRAHKGGIRVNSKENEGTTIEFFLPINENAIVENIETPQLEVKTTDGVILLVDDEKLVRDVGGLMLKRLGYTVLLAENGAEAINIFQENHERISLTVLDMSMPDQTGLQVFQSFYRINNQAKVLISSGHQVEVLEEIFKDEPITGFIFKPYQINALADTLQQYLS